MHATARSHTICRSRQQGLVIELALLVVIIATIAATAVPALKHFNKRSQYREIVDISVPVIGTVEKCLGLLRDPESCDSEAELAQYGGLKVHADSSSLLEHIELELKDERYSLSFHPPDSNEVIPFIDASLTLIKTAEIIDRNGRPVIETWETDPQSGCMLAGLC